MTAMPDLARTPGQLIQAALAAKGWSQRTLSVILRVGESTITRIVSGRQRIDASVALLLGEVLDVPAERFLAIQAELDLATARKTAAPDSGRAMRARLYGGLPIADMIRRGWLAAGDIRDTEAVDAALAEFFGVSGTDEVDRLLRAPEDARQPAIVTPGEIAWARRVRQIAGLVPAGPYARPAIHALVPELRPLLESVDGTAQVPRLLADHGIRLVIAEPLGSSQIDGACLWLDAHAPVIALSLRQDAIDCFWNVLLRELGRLLSSRRPGPRPFASISGDRAAGCRSLDDESLREQCISSAALNAFIARKAPHIAKYDVLEFSRSIALHPGIVAGEIQRKAGGYRRLDLFRVAVRSVVCPHAPTDGWGYALAPQAPRAAQGALSHRREEAVVPA